MESDSYEDEKNKLVGDLRDLLKEVAGFSHPHVLAAIAQSIDAAESDASGAIHCYPSQPLSIKGIRNSLFSDGLLEKMS